MQYQDISYGDIKICDNAAGMNDMLFIRRPLIYDLMIYVLTFYCGFCSNRILQYFPMLVSVLVTGVTSQVFSII